MKIGDGAWETLATYQYDDLGQLVEKTLGAAYQTQTFSYNIRGALLGMNDVLNLTDKAAFAYKLHYETKADGSPGYYNGNISGQTWASMTDRHTRHYDYVYDQLGRLKSADYSGKGAETYDVQNISYDLQGNIKRLTRFWGFGQADRS